MIPGGTFRMGLAAGAVAERRERYAFNRPGAFQTEVPEHLVTLSDFAIDACEVTQQRFAEFVSTHPEWAPGAVPATHQNGRYLANWTQTGPPPGKAQRPVVFVTWHAAQSFCRWSGGRLPTEAEWEFVARSRDDVEFPWGDALPSPALANYGASEVGRTTDVGSYPPNALGLYDLAGNVWEWLLDEWQNYVDIASVDPIAGGPVADDAIMSVRGRRAVRGASFEGSVVNLRTRWRDSHVVTNAVRFVGFRCAYPGRPSVESTSRASHRNRLADLAEQAVASGRVQGVQLAVVEDGELIGLHAFGVADRESGRAMTVRTPINVASISKSLTAWAVLALAQRKHIALASPINDHLESYRLPDGAHASAEVTVERLLSHTSGVSTPSAPVIPASKPVPSAVAVLRGESSVSGATIVHQPGRRYAYSGAGYLLLQKLIEDRTHSTFDDYVKKNVLGPASMTDSTFAPTPDDIERAAAYYRSDGRRREKYRLVGAAGGLYTTARDMARFIILHTEAGREARRTIISDAWFHEMLRPVIPVDIPGVDVGTTHYALGHNVYTTPNKTRIALHAGGNPGLRSLFVVAPDVGHGFFAVANDDDGAALLGDMLRTWGARYGWSLNPYF